MQGTHDLKDSSYCHNSKDWPLSVVLGNDCDINLKEEKLLLLFPETGGGGGAFNSRFRFLSMFTVSPYSTYDSISAWSSELSPKCHKQTNKQKRGRFKVQELADAMTSDSQESGDSLGVSRGTVMAPAQKRDRLPLLLFSPTSPQTLPASQAWWKDGFIQCLNWWHHHTSCADWGLSKNFTFKEIQTLGIPVEHSIWLFSWEFTCCNRCMHSWCF